MTGLIILAAGESKRLGQPKQNLLFQNKTLLQRAIDTAIASECRPIIVVLGANHALINMNSGQQGISFIINPDWVQGMASSIKAGVREIKKQANIEQVLIMLCDQPFVSSALIAGMLLKQQQTEQKIVACSYQETIGVPVLINSSLFDQLLSLQGNEGAKAILKNHIDDVTTIPFDMGSLDIDTMDDYERLLKITS